jgi:hypothetical protein
MDNNTRPLKVYIVAKKNNVTWYGPEPYNKNNKHKIILL